MARFAWAVTFSSCLIVALGGSVTAADFENMNATVCLASPSCPIGVSSATINGENYCHNCLQATRDREPAGRGRSQLSATLLGQPSYRHSIATLESPVPVPVRPPERASPPAQGMHTCSAVTRASSAQAASAPATAHGPRDRPHVVQYLPCENIRSIAV